VRGAYKDFEGKLCGTRDLACVPPGVCRPLILRAQAKSRDLLSAAWDLEADPDQRRNLLEGKYLGPETEEDSLRSEFLSCITAYAYIDGNKVWKDSPLECSRLADWRLGS